MSSLPSPLPMALSLMGKLKGLGLALYMMDLLYMDLDMEPMKLLFHNLAPLFNTSEHDGTELERRGLVWKLQAKKITQSS
jgi:hypothetical protein